MGKMRARNSTKMDRVDVCGKGKERQDWKAFDYLEAKFCTE